MIKNLFALIREQNEHFNPKDDLSAMINEVLEKYDEQELDDDELDDVAAARGAASIFPKKEKE